MDDDSDDFTTDNLVVKSYEHLPGAVLRELAPGLCGSRPVDTTTDDFTGAGLVDISDGSGRMADILTQHWLQLESHGKPTPQLFAEIGLLVTTEGEKLRPPHEPTRDTGFLCVACGRDRGTGTRCENCRSRAKGLHIIDGREV